MAKKKAAAKKTSVRRDRERWETLGVSALPAGYVNVFVEEDGGQFEGPCVALLTQSLVAIEVWQVVEGKDPKLVSSKAAKAKIRVVFGQTGDADWEVYPANLTPSYVGTIYDPAKFAAAVQREAASLMELLEAQHPKPTTEPAATEAAP